MGWITRIMHWDDPVPDAQRAALDAQRAALQRDVGRLEQQAERVDQQAARLESQRSRADGLSAFFRVEREANHFADRMRKAWRLDGGTR